MAVLILFPFSLSHIVLSVKTIGKFEMFYLVEVTHSFTVPSHDVSLEGAMSHTNEDPDFGLCKFTQLSFSSPCQLVATTQSNTELNNVNWGGSIIT